MAVAAGLEQVPPVIVQPIPFNANLPVEPPVQTPIPVANAAIERWKVMTVIITDYDLAKVGIESKNEIW